jgi:hypothetical protein
MLFHRHFLENHSLATVNKRRRLQLGLILPVTLGRNAASNKFALTPTLACGLCEYLRAHASISGRWIKSSFIVEALSMNRKEVLLFLLLGVVALISSPAQAQDKVELFGGYSYMHFDSSPTVNTNGWEISGEYKFAGPVGAVADFDGHYGSPFGASMGVHTFLFGPQVSWPARISPFAHVLIGGGHVSVGGASDTSFAEAIGGGIDAELIHGIYWRVIQGDLLHTSFFGGGQSNARISTGIVVHF